MREIRFRVWDGEDMISPDYIDRHGYGHWKSNSIPNASDKLMQFTGLLDKNGKEIYEGDIVRNNHNANFYVFWQEDECRWRLLGSYGDEITGNSGIMFNARNLEGSEVIGNIYENPELLK